MQSLLSHFPFWLVQSPGSETLLCTAVPGLNLQSNPISSFRNLCLVEHISNYDLYEHKSLHLNLVSG